MTRGGKENSENKQITCYVSNYFNFYKILKSQL